ncbi:MAG: DUF4190 domain-containing protein [Oscillospiraceae bacterium]|nr:DUF4190 domain-containing protein [Candidatus Ruminococcus equi]
MDEKKKNLEYISLNIEDNANKKRRKKKSKKTSEYEGELINPTVIKREENKNGFENYNNNHLENVDYVIGVDDHPGEKKKKDGAIFGYAALILGILGAVGGTFPYFQYFAPLFAVLGIIFGAISRKMSAEKFGKPSRIASLGLAFGIVGVCLSILGILCVRFCGNMLCVLFY